MTRSSLNDSQSKGSPPAIHARTAQRRSLNSGVIKSPEQASRPETKRPMIGTKANGRKSRMEPHGRKTVSRAEMRRP